MRLKMSSVAKKLNIRWAKLIIQKINIYSPYQVQEVIKIFGFNLSQIYPVCNYCSEIECDDDKDYLTLVAMRQILRYSEDYLKDKVGIIL